MSAHEPHKRLKALRKIIGLTQEGLAKKIGVSYPYLLAIETGQREMSPGVAERVFVETGICPEWLLDPKANADKPRSAQGEPYTVNVYSQWSERKTSDDSVPAHADILIQRTLWLVTQFLRASARKGRFGAADYLLRTELRKRVEELRIEDRWTNELATQPDPFMSVARTLKPKAKALAPGLNAAECSVLELVAELSVAVESNGLKGLTDAILDVEPSERPKLGIASVFSPAFICRVREAVAQGDEEGASQLLSLAAALGNELPFEFLNVAKKKPAKLPKKITGKN